ncbi:putative protein OS=Streptomyces fumanus OX=67302 GN=GCM10018772_40380 PE=4 SV=1 [Streptomyces fumanus]
MPKKQPTGKNSAPQPSPWDRAMSPGTLARLDQTLEEQRTRAAAAAAALDAAQTMLNISQQPRDFQNPAAAVPGQTQVAQAANQHLPAGRPATPRAGASGGLPYDPVRAATQQASPRGT